jgi:hypothetical protein
MVPLGPVYRSPDYNGKTAPEAARQDGYKNIDFNLRRHPRLASDSTRLYGLPIALARSPEPPPLTNFTAIAQELHTFKEKFASQIICLLLPCESGLDRFKFAYLLGLHRNRPRFVLKWRRLAQHSPSNSEIPAFFLLRFTISAVNFPLLYHHHCVVVRPPRSQADGEA